jgi:hypothetical protein
MHHADRIAHRELELTALARRHGLIVTLPHRAQARPSRLASLACYLVASAFWLALFVVFADRLSA